MKILEYTPEDGRMFHQVAKEAIWFAQSKADANDGVVKVNFAFNDIEMHAYNSSNPNDICLIYDLQNEIRRLKSGRKD